MDYNDALWDKALDELGKELTMSDYTLSAGKQTLDVNSSGTLKSHRMLKRLDAHKGTPPEQIKLMAERMAESVINKVESTLGWSDVIKAYDQFEVTVTIKGKKSAFDVSGGTVGKVKKRPFFDPEDWFPVL